MAGWSGPGSGLWAMFAGGAAASALIVGALAWQGRSPVAPPPIAPPPAPVVAEPVPAAAPAVSSPAPALPVPPSFDVVRVEPDGAALVAGRAEAGRDVAVLIDGAEAAVARVDRQGRFVVFLTLASSPQARVMTLELRRHDGAPVPSRDQVLLAPSGSAPVRPDPAPSATAATGTGTEPGEAGVAVLDAQPDAPVGVASAPAPAQTPASVAAPEAGAAPAVLAAPATEAAPAAEALPEIPVASAASGDGAMPGAPDAPAVAERTTAAPVPALTAQSTVAPAPAADPPLSTQPEAQTADTPAAPAAILLSGDTVRVLQAPETSGGPPGTISIDAISYTVSGAVALSGRGEAQAFVRLYLDNRAVLESAIGADGAWAATLPGVAPGVYTLRADQVSAQGQVTSRFETPFQRENPEALAGAVPSGPVSGSAEASAGGTDAPPGKVSITVQPGFTLWQIARETYGDGLLFVRVYDANKNLIRDPDLIYPGQVFTVPQVD